VSGQHRPLYVPRRNPGRLRLKCDGTLAETRIRLSTKRTSPFNSAGASVQSATGSRGVRISGSNTGYTMFRGSVKSTGYPLHSPVFPFTSPSRASLCAITFQLDSTCLHRRLCGLHCRPGCREQNILFSPAGIRNPDRPTRSLVTVPTTLYL
jgi:hypothetical protein